MTPSPALARVKRGQLCAGCGGCAAVAPGKIEMVMTPPGYLRPRQTADVSVDEEAAIAAICPGLVIEQDAGERQDDPLWGPVTGCRSGYATDPAVRRNASSGGGLSALLIHLLETGAVARVLQVAANPDVPVANSVVFNDTSEAVFAAAGSRYAPSAPLAMLEDILGADGQTAVIGKPCDIAALRAIAGRDPRVDAKIPYMLSFFCAGVPSQKGAEAVVEKLGVAGEDLGAFRYRGDGWPGFATATRHDGSKERMSYADSWGSILTQHLQFRCKICPDGTGGHADVVCADAWECDENGYPVFEERDGVSLFLSRTSRGESLVQAAMEAGRISADPLPLEAIAAMQPGQTGRKRNLLARLAGLAVLGRPYPRYRGFHIAQVARQNSAKKSLRNFAGMLRRTLRGQNAG